MDKIFHFVHHFFSTWQHCTNFKRQKMAAIFAGSLEHQLNKYSLDVCSVAQLTPEKCVEEFKVQIGQPLEAHNYNMLQLNPKRFVSEQGWYLNTLTKKYSNHIRKTVIFFIKKNRLREAKLSKTYFVNK